MKAYIRQVKGITMVSKSDSNHWLVMDGSERFGGSRAASGPMEMVLMALGGCTCMDVISILQKMRTELDRFEMFINAERAAEHPKVFTKIHLDYFFFGSDIKEESVKRAVELSQEKYCSVSAMLASSADIIYKYHINESIPAELQDQP
jgi:putative redox protein